MDTKSQLGASRSMSRSFHSTQLLLKKQLWVWPLLAALVLLVIGYWMRRAVDNAMAESIATQLQAIVNADVAALEAWMKAEGSYAAVAADDPRIAAIAREMIQLGSEESATPAALAGAPQRKELEKRLAPWLERYGFTGYVVANAQEKIVTAARDELIGRQAPAVYHPFLARAIAGETLVSQPYPSTVALVDAAGQTRTGVPTMHALAPLRDEDGKIIGALGLRIPPEKDFTWILNVARMGNSGETYAFNREGMLLSQSRFDDDLKRLGILPDREDAQSILNVDLRDPQVDLTRGEHAPLRRSLQPLNYMVTEAIEGRPGVDLVGHRDYRGVPSFGAWTWLDKYDFGIATEVDIAEASRAGVILAWAFWGLFALLAAASIAIFVFTLVVARLQQSARKAALAVKKLGQYALEEKIGAGGMGVVYRGHHSMLRRPTAIKLLDLERTTEEGIRRFEREVSLTSQLNHPNTIAIYDYGRTPEGIFYYAMELLEGLDLEKLVRTDGPQPEGRVIHLLVQVCGSLGEAHRRGLIHRDIKPANIFLTERGGVPDFVKLLDFGLVKAVDSAKEQQVTMTGSLTGTPLYMSPESIQHPETVDARSDLYALGAVGYYLLTGSAPFRGKSLVELCAQQVSETPEAPSQRLAKPVSAELEAALLWCLEKKPEDRPATAAQLAEALRNCPTASTWTEAAATAWWTRRPQAALATTMDAATVGPADDGTAVWTKE